MSYLIKFNNGLLGFVETMARSRKKYNLTYDDVKTWKYIGGNQGNDLKYFKTIHKNKSIPEFTNKCLCEHIIKKNCYISNNDLILIVGSCCIKRFIDKGLKRLCLTCEKPYKGTYRCCSDCRKTRCWTCCCECLKKYCSKCSQKNRLI
jgi:hypothetical protein